MFRKLVESVEKASVKSGLKDGKLFCPDCGAKAGRLPAEWDRVMECSSCGAKASLPEWVAKDGTYHGRADLPPAATRIRKEGDGIGGTIWHIPAGGKYVFFLFFAALWLGITVLVSGGFFIAILSGGEIEGNMPVWVLIPFSGIFYAVGFGVLYAGLRQKYMRHRLTVSGGGVAFQSEMFGRKKEKSLPSGTVKSIAQKEFFQQNYTPVYGIEIKGTGGKLRFGSTLTEDEKAWLVADLKDSVFVREKAELKMSVAGHAGRTKKEVFSVAIPEPQKFGWVAGLFLAVMGVSFACVGIFVIDGEPLPEKGESGEYGFDLVFSLFNNGFRGIWLLMSSIFAGIGISFSIASLRGIGQDRRIEGNSAEISIRTYKHGLVVKDKSFPRSTVADIRTSSTGSSNGTQLKRIELIIGDKAERITSWTEGDAADALVAELREAMGH
jgi:hypothetical protein